MTLLLASIRQHEIVLTADGRSTTMTNGVVTAIDDHYQKIFPVPDHPLVICHAGENLLDGQPVRKFLKGFMQQLNPGNFTILQIADNLRRYAHAAIRTRLTSLNSPATGVNLWVAGFSFQEDAPMMVELFWIWKDEVLTTEERRYAPIEVVAGGDGKKQIDAVDWHKIDGKTTDEVRAYHQLLEDEAMNAKVTANSVGGDICELVITPARWTWTRPPRM